MKKYTVSDGKLVLTLEEAQEGGFIVTSPLEPSLTTQAETISEAFVMARDALALLREWRQELRRKARPPAKTATRRRSRQLA